MKVMVACEFSGIIREAFRARGHEAYSCDLLDTEWPSDYHIKGDIREQSLTQYDLLIAHPPCTALATSGARWFKDKVVEQQEAIAFCTWLLEAPVPRIAMENPIGVLSTKLRKPDQIIQPWQFGHGETKATCLWLKNLPKLVPTNIVEGRGNRIHMMPDSKDRWKKRSITFQGIAEAMVLQWCFNE